MVLIDNKDAEVIRTVICCVVNEAYPGLVDLSEEITLLEKLSPLFAPGRNTRIIQEMCDLMQPRKVGK